VSNAVLLRGDEEGFRERVYNGVVAELEAILECTKLSKNGARYSEAGDTGSQS
jgi:hypothetical protein